MGMRTCLPIVDACHSGQGLDGDHLGSLPLGDGREYVRQQRRLLSCQTHPIAPHLLGIVHGTICRFNQGFTGSSMLLVDGHPYTSSDGNDISSWRGSLGLQEARLSSKDNT